MSDATIVMSQTSQETLRHLAERTGKSTSAILDAALEDYRRKCFLEECNAGYAALRDDPNAWSEAQSERNFLEGTLMDGLDVDESWTKDGVAISKHTDEKAS
jgi:hypothetical protein